MHHEIICFIGGNACVNGLRAVNEMTKKGDSVKWLNLDETSSSLWLNEQEKVYMMNCGWVFQMGGICEYLHLKDVDYNTVSAYGHFGKSGLPWEE